MQNKGVNVYNSLSVAKVKEMKESKAALIKILSSLLYLTRQGLAIRGHTDENSNIQQLLLLRSGDSTELNNWLSRTNYKWLSHDIQNEIISLLSRYLQNDLIKKIKESEFFSIVIDETTDNSGKEQVSICFRTVDNNLNVDEIFMGFFETAITDAKTLLELVTDVLSKLTLNISNCRGQCYDGAANVSGHKSGLQKRINDLESRALYVHFTAHTLNLVVQDAMMNVERSRDFLFLVRSIIVFVRNSPKRQAIFNSLQVKHELTSRSYVHFVLPVGVCA